VTQIPPSTNIDGTETLKAMTDDVANAMARLSDYIANTAVQLHPDIVRLLQSEGLDGSNRLGFGSSANSTANGFVALARRSAEQAEATGKLLRALHLYWVKNIKTPVEAAIKARETQNRPRLKV
jgi:hypothetical protein